MPRYFPRNEVTSATVASGFSSMIQCPEPERCPSTLVATARMITAIVEPNDFSPPSANTGIVSFPSRRMRVVDHVLIKGLELREGGMHRSRLRIQRRIVRARRLGIRRARRRALVPEPIEVDPLTPCHQPLGIRTPEGEMPGCMALDDLIPWPDSSERRIDQHESAHTARVPGCERIAHHVADVMRHEVGLCDLSASSIPAMS